MSTENPNWQAETIQVNQIFTLLDPKRVKRTLDEEPALPHPVDEFRSALLLATDLLPTIPLRVMTTASTSIKGGVMTPFDPKLGYQITDADFDLAQRIEKIQAAQEELLQRIDFDQTPLYLGVRAYSEDLYSAGLGTKTTYPEGDLYDIKPEYVDDLERLRLRLFFSDDTFEARASIAWFSFFIFYPKEKGPLAHPPLGEMLLQLPYFFQHLDEGLAIYLPSDLDTLSQIQAQFVFA